MCVWAYQRTFIVADRPVLGTVSRGPIHWSNPEKKNARFSVAGAFNELCRPDRLPKSRSRSPRRCPKVRLKRGDAQLQTRPAEFNDRLTCDVALNLTLLLLNFDIEPRKDPSLPLRPNEKVILLILHLLPAVCLSQLICFGVDPRLWTPWYFPSLWWKKGSRQKLPRHSSAINRVSYQ